MRARGESKQPIGFSCEDKMKLLPVTYEDEVQGLFAVIKIEFEGDDGREALEQHVLPALQKLLDPTVLQKGSSLPVCPHCGIQPCELKMDASFVAPQWFVGVNSCQNCHKIVGTVLLPGPGAGRPAPTSRIHIPS